MSLVHVKRPDELVTCPYNPAHRVTSLRLPVHLLKCEKSAPKMATCPFNASHRISETDRAAHISTCPDKAYVERTLVATTKSNIQKVPPYTDNEIPEPTENWENECNPLPTAGYDPTTHMNELTFRNAPTLASLTKSEKKQFYSSLNSSHRSVAGSTSTTDSQSVENMVNQLTPVLKQLRLPKEEAIVEKAKQPPNRSFGLGRGHSRLAANIFQGSYASSISSESTTLNSDKISDFMAIARGRGICRPSPLSSLPKVGRKENVAPDNAKEDLKDAVNGNRKISSPVESSQTDEPQLEKLKRRLQKKLRQIEILILQQEDGRVLNQDELNKISKKLDIEKQLQELDL